MWSVVNGVDVETGLDLQLDSLPKVTQLCGKMISLYVLVTLFTYHPNAFSSRAVTYRRSVASLPDAEGDFCASGCKRL